MKQDKNIKKNDLIVATGEMCKVAGFVVSKNEVDITLAMYMHKNNNSDMGLYMGSCQIKWKDIKSITRLCDEVVLIPESAIKNPA